MKYTPQQLTALMDEINSQGGVLLPDRCASRDEEYDAKTYPEMSDAGRQVRRLTQGCGHTRMFIHAYEPTSDAQRKRGAGLARACATCDDVGQWPRYRTAVFEGEES